MKRLRIVMVIFLSITLTSCVSMMNMSKTQFGDEDCSFPPYTYGGAITSATMIAWVATEIPKEPYMVVGGAILLVDFPLTLAMDTIALPISIVRDVVACTKDNTPQVSVPP